MWTPCGRRQRNSLTVLDSYAEGHLATTFAALDEHAVKCFPINQELHVLDCSALTTPVRVADSVHDAAI
jgi:hypothetical protein